MIVYCINVLDQEFPYKCCKENGGTCMLLNVLLA